MGFAQVFLIAAGFAVVSLWVLRAGAMVFEERYEWGPVFTHLFLIYSFAFFYPGQTLLTYRVTDRRGREYIIIGREDEADV